MQTTSRQYGRHSSAKHHDIYILEDGCAATHRCLQIKSNLFAQIYHINIGSSKSVHEQGQQGWKQH